MKQKPMNTKTAARMRRVQNRFLRIADACEREIKKLSRVQHTKPEDFHAGVALRDVADLCRKHAGAVAVPAKGELIAS